MNKPTANILSQDPVFCDWALRACQTSGLSTVQTSLAEQNQSTPPIVHIIDLGSGNGSEFDPSITQGAPYILCHEGDADQAIMLCNSYKSCLHVQGRLLDGPLGLDKTLALLKHQSVSPSSQNYLKPGTPITKLPLRSDTDCQQASEQLERFAGRTSKLPEFKGDVATTLQELLVNAKVASLEDTKRDNFKGNGAWPEQLALTLVYGADDTALTLSLEDPSGRLDCKRIIDSLSRCAAKGEGQVIDPPSSAGIGLYMVLHMASRLDFYLLPGHSTTVTVSFRIGQSPRTIAATPRSLHFFVGTKP